MKNKIFSNKWRIIAKNNIKVWSSKFRDHRTLFFVLISVFTFLWALWLAPIIVNFFIDNLWNYGEAFLPLISYNVEFMFLIFSSIVFILPISAAFQDFNGNQSEILLTTPIKEGDILMGKFMGKFPIYIWGVIVIAPIIVNFIGIFFELSFLDQIIIILALILLLFIAGLSGTLCTRFALKKISTSKNAKDFGTTLSLVAGFSIIVMIYSLQAMGSKAATDENLRKFLQIFPSTWLANIVNATYGAEPILEWLSPWLSALFSIVLIFFLIYIGISQASNFYSRDKDKLTKTKKYHTESWFFRVLRKILPEGHKIIILSQLKELFRRKENVVKFIFCAIFIFFLAFFYKMAFENNVYPNSGGGSSIFMVIITIIFLPMMSGMVVSLQLGTVIFIQSKDIVWVYKQSPKGIKGLIFANIQSHLIFLIPLGILLWAFNVAQLDFTTLEKFLYLIYLTVNLVFSFILSQGIQCLNPVYKEKSSKMTINVFLFIFIQIPVLFLILFLYLDEAVDSRSPMKAIQTDLLNGLGIFVGLITLISTILLTFGIRHISKLE
jgi:hypothetical protein